MLIEIPKIAVRTLSTRTDEEMYFATKALAQAVGTDPSTVIRLAVAALLKRARSINPVTMEQLKDVA